MSVEWIVTGIILLGGMAAAGISLYIKRRREAQEIADSTFSESEKTDYTQWPIITIALDVRKSS